MVVSERIDELNAAKAEIENDRAEFRMNYLRIIKAITK
jgi:hypothetical protein